MSTPLTTTTSRGSQRTPGAPRTEDEMAATGLTWDDSTRSWVNEEDVAREGISSRTSQATAVGAEDKLEKGPSEEVIWLEWEENDPQNPFNVSAGFSSSSLSSRLPRVAGLGVTQDSCSLVVHDRAAVESSKEVDDDLDQHAVHPSRRIHRRSLFDRNDVNDEGAQLL